MRPNLTTVSIAIALMAVQCSNAAPMVQTFSPSSPINVDYADDSCALRREFMSGEDKVLLELRQFAPGDTFYATAASTSFRPGLRPLRVRFLPDAMSHVAAASNALNYPNRLFGYSWTDSFIPVEEASDKLQVIGSIPDRIAREKAIQGIELSEGLRRPIVLATGEMKRPMDVMRKCMDELLTHWGIDAVAHGTLSRRAMAKDQQKWAQVIQNRYPDEMLRQSKGGIVRVRIMVGIDGQPTSCHMQVRSQDPSFETTACAGIMKAARFEPALDAGGKPIASYFVTSIFYKVN